MEFEESLRNLGLSHNEIRVYIALLKLGNSKVDGITKQVSLPRTTIYGILKSLLEKGLVSYVIMSGIKHYEATGPKRLLVKEQEKILLLKKIIPSLEEIKNTVGERPTIELYESKEGIKSVYEDILKERKTIYGYGNTKLLFQFLEYYVPNYIKRRKKLGINFLVITEKSDISIDMKSKDKEEKRQTKFIDDMEKTTTVTYMYADKISIMTLIKEHPIGVIIKNEEIYNTQKILFDFMWKIAKS